MASVMSDNVRAVADLEVSLLKPAVRRSARDLEKLLAPPAGGDPR